MTPQEIAEHLNRIESEGAQRPGQNSADVWAWVQTRDEWDALATGEQDPSGASDLIVLKDGAMIRWNGQYGKLVWEVCGP